MGQLEDSGGLVASSSGGIHGVVLPVVDWQWKCVTRQAEDRR